MNQFSWNLIEVNILILILFVCYIGIRARLNFTQQRTVLIGLPIVAIATILMKSAIDISSVSYALQVVELEPVLLVETLSDKSIGLAPIISLNQIYLLGFVGFGLLFVFRIARIISFLLKNDSKKIGKYNIYKVKEKPSFSFFNYIQITPSLNPDEQEIVLEHEKVHVEKKHSIDTVFMEIVHILFWFNPVFFFIKREMVNLHEYQVDALMYKKHKVSYMKFLVNYALGLNGSNYLLTSRFYNRLTLKKRINIMKIKTKKYPILLAMLPIIMMAFTFISWTIIPEEPQAELVTESTEETVEDIDKYPSFPGGDEAMNKFIIENIVYPSESKIKGEKGSVFIGFVVQADGAISNSFIRASSKHELLDEEALRVINLMPNWEAGEKDGQKVKVDYTLPIQFRLSE